MQNMQKITTQRWPGTWESLQMIIIKNDTEIRSIARIMFNKNYPHFDFLRNIEQDSLYRTGSWMLETSNTGDTCNFK